MILIVSEYRDESTNWVIDWISWYNEKFFRLNMEELLSSEGSRFLLTLDNQATSVECFSSPGFNTNEIKSVWFRRSLYPYLPKHLSEEIKDDNVTRSLYHEYWFNSSFIYSHLEKGKRTLGNYRATRLNKLEVLDIAKSFQIDIPATLVTSRKMDIEKFILEKGAVVTKPISEVFDIRQKKNDTIEVYINYTEELTEETLSEIPDSFSYSLFQEKLSKELDIRTVFLAGECYSMAIFSQLETKTSVDFRKYSNNRNVPYKLPDDLERRITRLMNHLDLNTGSIDFVKTRDGRHVFLEINPTGQYGMTSDPCNYYIDKKIAEYLINNQ